MVGEVQTVMFSGTSKVDDARGDWGSHRAIRGRLGDQFIEDGDAKSTNVIEGRGLVQRGVWAVGKHSKGSWLIRMGLNSGVADMVLGTTTSLYVRTG